MRIAIVGSRSVLDDAWVYDQLDDLFKDMSNMGHITVLSGGAKGADTLAREYAEKNGYDFILFKPYHLIDKTVEYTPKYFFTRNKQLVDNCDMLVALCDGETAGTQHAIKYARKSNKEVLILNYPKDEG